MSERYLGREPLDHESIDVCIVGNMVADVIVRPGETFPPVGEIEFVESIGVQPGGNAVNTAIALGVLGHRSLPVGRVGRDAFGSYLIGSMDEAGADIEAVIRDEAATAVTVAGVRPDGERSFLHMVGANALVSGDDIPWDAVAKARIFHLTSVYVLPAFDGESGVESLRRAKSLGLTTVLDVCWDADGRWMTVLADYLPHADYFLPNIDEARALTGKETPDDIADDLLDRGCGAVVIKLGRDGCFLATPTSRRHVRGFRVQAIDSTGAGDAFGAGFMAALLRGHEVESAVRIANAVGAHWVTAPAADGLRTFEEIAAWAAEEHS